MRRITALLGLLILFGIGCSEDKAPPTAPKASAPLLSWTFDSDLDGWDDGVATSGVWGTVTWLDREGGVVKLDGVGYAGEPNAWIDKTIDLPGDAKTLRYVSSAHDRGDGAVSLRVRLIDANSDEHTIQDWEELATGDEGFEFFPKSLDISAYAGQTVTIYFEIGDIDGGGNNQRYLDNIEIDK